MKHLQHHARTKVPTAAYRTNHKTRGHARTAGIAAIGLVTAASILGSVAPAQAKVTIPCTNSGYKCDDTGYGKVANRSYWTMAAGHNCTNYVAYRLIQDGMPKKVTWLHNGGDWAREAKKHGYAVDQSPTVGSVAQWNHGAGGLSAAGHVAYVVAVTENSVTVAEDNYSSGPMSIRTITSKDPGYPSNFIHFTPKSTPTQATTAPASNADWQEFVSDYKQAFIA